jgi:multiple sugar transport system substrate-binding protein
MLGETSPDQGAKDIGTRMEAILKKEGYYDGKKPLLQ